MGWLSSFAGVLSTASIWVMTRSKGVLVGSDEFGNKYYRSKKPDGNGLERRWVMYGGDPEATKVPPGWHAWLHRQVEAPPAESIAQFQRPWQKPHHPNLTGTPQAYRPPGHVLSGGKRDKASGDYEAWTPPE